MNTQTRSFETILAAALLLCVACAGGGGTTSNGMDSGGAPALAGSNGSSVAGSVAMSGAPSTVLGGAGGAGGAGGGSAGGGSGAGTGGENLQAGSAGTSAGGSTGSAGGASGGGSGGQPSAVVAFDSGRVSVTGVRGTTSPPATSVIKLHNSGTSAVQVKGVALSGANQALFKVTPASALPATLAAGTDLAVTIEMMTTGATLPAAPADKNLGCVFLTGTLTATLDSGSASASVYGLVLTLVNYEATLGQILTALGYKLNVGQAQDNWNPNTSMNATTLPGIEKATDEVAASHFVKAGAGNVGMTLVARFSPPGALPYGWYLTTTGCPTGCTTLGTMAQINDAQTSDKARMIAPPPGPGSMTTFDPGSAAFGLWVYSDQKTQKFNPGTQASANGDWDYSEDALNTPAKVHRFKSYPLKDAAGTAIPQTYLVAVEEAGNGDYQDYVFVLSNVTAMP